MIGSKNIQAIYPEKGKKRKTIHQCECGRGRSPLSIAQEMNDFKAILIHSCAPMLTVHVYTDSNSRLHYTIYLAATRGFGVAIKRKADGNVDRRQTRDIPSPIAARGK